MLEECVETAKRVQGPEHPETLRFSDNLAFIVLKQGFAAEAGYPGAHPGGGPRLHQASAGAPGLGPIVSSLTALTLLKILCMKCETVVIVFVK